MKRVKKITVRKKVDADKYVNVETGEFLSSFVDNLTSETDTSFVRMDYVDYVVVDRKVLNFLKDIFKPQDLGRITAMITDTEGTKNILMNKDIPHNDKSLAEAINYTRTKYVKFMDLMYRSSIVYKLKGYNSGKEMTLFIFGRA